MVRRRALVGISNDYDVVVSGLSRLLTSHDAVVEVAGAVAAGGLGPDAVDVVVFDTYGRAVGDPRTMEELSRLAAAAPVVVLAHDLHPTLLADARRAGATSFASKALPGSEIAEVLVRTVGGEAVVAGTPTSRAASDELTWPGKERGLSERESHVLALVAEGRSNREAAEALHLSPETVKAYIGRVFTKLALRNRVEATSFVLRSDSFRRPSLATSR